MMREVEQIGGVLPSSRYVGENDLYPYISWEVMGVSLYMRELTQTRNTGAEVAVRHFLFGSQRSTHSTADIT